MGKRPDKYSFDAQTVKTKPGSDIGIPNGSVRITMKIVRDGAVSTTFFVVFIGLANSLTDSRNCTSVEFRCRNGDCIASEKLCDGPADCSDQSDETRDECTKPQFICPEHAFRCDYGSCIDISLKCNGITNCADGSDEDRDHCQKTTRPPWSLCPIPSQPQNGRWQLHKSWCNPSSEHCNVLNKDALEPHTRLIYSCTDGFSIRGSEDVFCGPEGKWSKKPVCLEIRCKSLVSASIQVDSCIYHDKWTSCESPVLPGTVANISCQNGYHRESTLPSTQRDNVRCNARGQWEPEPIRCIPKCGITTTTSIEKTPLVYNDSSESPKVSDFPWHATLYKREGSRMEFKCVATIIKNDLLITAAHCVYDETRQRVYDANEFAVMPGNIRRSYAYYDNLFGDSTFVKKVWIAHIYVMCDYIGKAGGYAKDIAILHIRTPFVFSAHIMPACLDTSGYSDQLAFEVGKNGKVAGFGKTIYGLLNQVLQYHTIPVVSLDECIERIGTWEPKTTFPLFMEDKLCGRQDFAFTYAISDEMNTLTRSAVCDGNTGGGLVLKKDGLWYLRGILSSGVGPIVSKGKIRCRDHEESLYTKVSSYIKWIQSVIIELEMYNNYPVCSNTIGISKHLSSSALIDLANSSRVSRNCSRSAEFRCQNGDCIATEKLCDGRADCSDYSDEIEPVCRMSQFMCPEYAFRCDYGACVDGDAPCNGINDCFDRSDELLPRCRSAGRDGTKTYRFDIATESPWRPTQSTLQRLRPCQIPSQPQNGRWQLYKSQCPSDEHCDVHSNDALLPGTQLIYSCVDGYRIKGSEDVFCGLEGKWSIKPVCVEIRCKPLVSASIQVDSCTYNNEMTSCESAILPRTEAMISCRNSYHQEALHLSTQRNVVRCNARGQWEPEPIRCHPKCGITTTTSIEKTPLIFNGELPKLSDFPWHASLYKQESSVMEFKCGATIIREDLLITAAHCIYDETRQRVDDANKFAVATGNIFRDYDSPFHNPTIVKKTGVARIYVICNYLGSAGNYAGDIAILHIRTPFVFSAHIMPACLDNSGYSDQWDLEVGKEGKVAGFGRTSSGQLSQVLQYLTVPVVSFDVCLPRNATLDTVALYTMDKLCVGYTNGSAVCDGDSGGGLVFQKEHLWYLRGIVSVGVGQIFSGGTRRCNEYKESLYTKISSHIEWIKDVIIKLEMYNNYPVCPNRTMSHR